VSERVSEEMCEALGLGSVGYQIRMDAKKSAQTKLLFCTTGETFKLRL
jgi:HrpA-like RNA helicase